HQGDPQPDIIALMGAESTGTCLVLLDLVPVGRVLEPVHSCGMKEFLPRDRQHEHAWEKSKRTFVVASRGKPQSPRCPGTGVEPARAWLAHDPSSGPVCQFRHGGMEEDSPRWRYPDHASSNRGMSRQERGQSRVCRWFQSAKRRLPA